MTFTFRPPVGGQSPIFLCISGGTNTGKSWSSLLLARGLVGPAGRIAAVDTEGGRLTNLRRHHSFDLNIMDPPFTPTRFAEAAEEAQAQGYGAILFDSASMLHVGPGGYRDWHRQEVERLAKGKEEDFQKFDWMARKAPSLDRQQMLYRMLQLRIPVIYSCRARELTEKVGTQIKPIGWQPVIHQEFIYDMTVGLTLLPEDGKGIIRHQKPFKIEADLLPVFVDGTAITVQHGERVMDVMRSDGGPQQSFEIQTLTGAVRVFPSIQAWDFAWQDAIRQLPAEKLRRLRADNGPRMGEYAGSYSDVVEALQERLDAAIGLPLAESRPGPVAPTEESINA